MAVENLTCDQAQKHFEEEMRRNPAGLTLIGGAIVLGVETFMPSQLGDPGSVGLLFPEGTDVQRGNFIMKGFDHGRSHKILSVVVGAHLGASGIDASLHQEPVF